MTRVPDIRPLRQREPRIVKRSYLDYLRDQPCIVTGKRDVEPAHLRLLGSGGVGLKPNDSRALSLYWELHRRQSTEGELPVWLWCVNEYPDFLERLLIEVAESRFEKWSGR